MQLLLDTHVLLWWLADDQQLGMAARAEIADGNNTVYVSAASVWEIEIKRAIGKLDAPLDLQDVLQNNGFQPLPMTASHATFAGRLPPHHGDPFDRMLIAQAITEDLMLVTKAAAFAAYEDLALLDWSENA